MRVEAGEARGPVSIASAAAQGGWAGRVLEVGQRQLLALGGLVDLADPRALVAPRNRLLCAGLALLSTCTHRALGGALREAEVERAGALLSLLTKIDDQVIDSPDFHQRGSLPRAEVEARTLAYLAPTLASLRQARPLLPEGRCLLAAELGLLLRGLAADPHRLRRSLDAIALGWRVQARAVATLSACPGTIPLDQIERITTAISACWLRMMILLGELPPDARLLTPAELAAVRTWGHWIQRADALADLGKDIEEGLRSSLPGALLHAIEPEAYLRACAPLDLPWLHARLREHRIPHLLLPPPDVWKFHVREPASLGELPGLLAFVHRFLSERSPLLFRGSDPGVEA
ncbi:MAG: hypothetical protein MUF64_32500 [Polyangiaceae bacterium]|jgi:hypothetical protein|nr:hypothetical protein [Polyangiaceae bacterium]